jgi:hypothetical protein
LQEKSIACRVGGGGGGQWHNAMPDFIKDGQLVKKSKEDINTDSIVIS